MSGREGGKPETGPEVGNVVPSLPRALAARREVLNYQKNS
jgi:hypothetical protein